MDKMFTPKEVAKILGVSTEFVRDLYHNKLLAGTQINFSSHKKHIRFSRENIEDFLREKRGAEIPARSA